MKKYDICVIGLGYVGLPIALILSKKYNVVGFDINKTRVNQLIRKKDVTLEVESNKLKSKNIQFTSESKKIKNCNFYIITVPTPVNKRNLPDLRSLKNASKIVGRYLKKKDTVVYESTTYPGCTEEVCVPILEKYSNLKLNNDFYCGYSPERINPGDKKHTIENISKIVSASNSVGLQIVKSIYKNVTKKKLIISKTIKVAEGAKIIENTQRDLNIALMNELSILFKKLNIDFSEVLDAANTKWNFLNFKPGLVGGHCIGVDPYYLAYKAKKINFDPKVILSGRKINENMFRYIVKQIIKKYHTLKVGHKNRKILVLGLTFKEDVPDCRNSQSIKMVKELLRNKFKVFTFDPLAKTEIPDCKIIKNFNDLERYQNFFDCILFSVPHKNLINKGFQYFKKFKKDNALFFDIKNAFKNKSDFKL